MRFPKMTQKERDAFENGVIQVNGKAMNRTALGIVAAYFRLFPGTTFRELKEAFPDTINPSGPYQPKSIFKPFTDRDFGVVHSLEEIKAEFSKAGLPYEGLFFLGPDEMFRTSDGVTVIVNRLWETTDRESGRSDLEALADQAKKFGIVVNKFEPRQPFGKGSYSLDILQPELCDKISGTGGNAPPGTMPGKKGRRCSFPAWGWILIGLAAIIAILLISRYFNN